MKKIMNAYKYLFYKLYSWGLRCNGPEDMPHITAIFSMAFLIFVNLLTLLQIIQIITGFNYETLRFTHIQITVVAIIILGILYQLLMKNRKYEIYVKEFSKEEKKSRIKGTMYVWCYIVASLLGAVFFAYLSSKLMDVDFSILGYLHDKFMN